MLMYVMLITKLGVLRCGYILTGLVRTRMKFLIKWDLTVAQSGKSCPTPQFLAGLY